MKTVIIKDTDFQRVAESVKPDAKKRVVLPKIQVLEGMDDCIHNDSDIVILNYHLILSEGIQFQLNKKKFQSRMGLAYISITAMITLTILLWFFVPMDRLEICVGMSPYIYFAFTTIMGAGMGLKSWSEKK